MSRSTEFTCDFSDALSFVMNIRGIWFDRGLLDNSSQNIIPREGTVRRSMPVSRLIRDKQFLL